jgi:hypothetical protein
MSSQHKAQQAHRRWRCAWRRERESAESDAQSDAPSEEELRRQKVAAQFERYGLTPRSLAMFCLSIVFLLVMYFLVLLVEALGILVGLLTLQPLPFLHLISRAGYALMALLMVGPPLFLWIAKLLPHGSVARVIAATKQEHPERYHHQFWKRAINLFCNLILTAYLILLALAPAVLIDHWPVWSLPPVVTGLINTAIFLGITSLVGLIVGLPTWLVNPPDLQKITGRQKTDS